VIRAVGVETGGSNVQFAVNPETDEIVVIEMNPRVSRSSALASKATGFPIAKIAARLAVGYALEEIPNDITLATPASFEPTIDYVVVKWPRFAFEKFQGSDSSLTTQMKSVGEAMAIGRTFNQAFAKAMRSRELDAVPAVDLPVGELLDRIRRPGPGRYDELLEALRRGASVEEVHAATSIDWWFLRELAALVADPGPAPGEVRTFKSVDTCAAEFAARTPYYYSAWERPGPDGKPVGEVERTPPGGTPHDGAQAGSERPSVVILGSGPNRIGQGIEFDYCCVHAAMTVRESGRDAVMINCNPETVSTDYDTSDRLYFEPLTLDDVLGVIEVERPEGVIVQFGGQTPLRLAAGLRDAGVRLLGTGVDAIDAAEDRGRFGALLDRLGYQAPPYATAHSVDGALAIAREVGFPLLVRPSYVLGGRAMEIVYSTEDLADYLVRTAPHGSGPGEPAPNEREIFLDRFLEHAIEVDVDALCDGREVWIGGIMQHVEEAGIHSGDSACVLPPHSLGPETLARIRDQTRGIALELGVVGLLNIQFAVTSASDDGDGTVYVIEANPRASRTVPFVSKAVGVPLAKMACRLVLGEALADLGLPEDPMAGAHVSVKEAVLPFNRFVGADSLLGPEMRSTGEVMGIAADYETAFAKAQAAAGAELPTGGTVFITVTDADKAAGAEIAVQLHGLGFTIVATRGTARAMEVLGVPATTLNKVGEGSPHVVDWIERGDIDLVINTPTGSGARSDGWEIRRAAVMRGIPCITTLSGGQAAARAIGAGRAERAPVVSLQEIHAPGPGGGSSGAVSGGAGRGRVPAG
jgi:carbamoyl-phosphate synthase large subunit